MEPNKERQVQSVTCSQCLTSSFQASSCARIRLRRLPIVKYYRTWLPSEVLILTQKPAKFGNGAHRFTDVTAVFRENHLILRINFNEGYIALCL